MIKVFSSGSLDKTVKEINAYIEKNLKSDFHLIGFSSGTRAGGGGLFTFEVNLLPSTNLKGLGEIKLIQGALSNSVDFENKMNVAIKEGWEYLQMAPPYFMAIFHRSREQNFQSQVKKWGFTNADDYLAFKETGFNSKKEYEEFLLTAQESKLEFLKTFDQIKNKIIDAKNSGKNDDLIRIGYTLLEKMVKVLSKLYLKTDIVEDPLELEIVKIEAIFKHPLIDYDDFRNWRDIRNNIVHDLYVPSDDESLKFAQFLNKTVESLGALLIKAKIDGNFTKIIT